ncbi:MAG: hypothetical protein JSS41_07040 [Proteobacteria bacterium]|nr:hypothetical protein [Pseudomonadota bacterium]
MAAAALAAPAPPEVVRPPGSTTAQAVGVLHTLRNIPEACVRLEGLFTGDTAEPYRVEVLPGDRCVQRALYVDARELKAAPSPATHWLLNDRIAVPLAQAPACVATVEIWRKPGTAAPPKLDAQGRARIFLDKPQTTDGLPRFRAVLDVSRACKSVPTAG